MNTLRKNIISIHGLTGKIWLSQLPEIVKKYSDTWKLTHLEALKNLSHNYVLGGVRNHQPVILKLSLDIHGLHKETLTLEAFADYGAVTVLEQQPGALLLERAIPGSSLKAFFPDEDLNAVSIICKVIQRLHQAPIPAQAPFPHVNDWLTALDKEWNVPIHYLKKARIIKEFLLKTSASDVLLHGDLHHDNILKNGDEWVVIDPKGVIGEPAYEPAAFIRNSIPEPLDDRNQHTFITNRINAFSKNLELEDHRIRAWCFVQAMLAWVWALEDKTDPTYFQNLTDFFVRNGYDHL